MTHRLQKLGLFLFVLLPQVVLADSLAKVPTVLDLFTPPPTDRSIAYLGQLFGSVGNVLHSTSGEFLGQVFDIFNYGLIVAVSGIVAYSVVYSTLIMSQDGSFMSKQRMSMGFMALRTAAGFGLLAPAFNGYSTIQVIVMYIVVHGVGFADMAWDRALTYIDKGGPVYTQPVSAQSMITLNSGPLYVGDFLRSEVCMYTSQHVAQKRAKAAQGALQKDPNNPLYQQEAKIRTSGYIPQYNETAMSVSFPGGIGGAFGKANCGSYGWAQQGGTYKANVDQYKEAAVKQIVIDLMPLAERLSTQPIPTDKQEKQGLDYQAETAVIGAAADYLNITLPARSSLSGKAGDEFKKYYKTAMMQGWIMAGSYYYMLGSVQQNIKKATQMILTQPQGPPATRNQIGNLGISGKDADNLYTMLNTTIPNYVTKAKTQAGIIAQYEKEDSGARVRIGRDWLGKVFTLGGSGKINIFHIGWLNSALKHMSDLPIAWANILSGHQGNPILQLQTFGQKMMQGVIWSWIGVVGVVLTLVLLMANGMCVSSLGAGVMTFATAILMPIVFILGGILLSAGAVLAIYVPLIPYIIFTVAAISWLIYVIEAMVAGPLVAMGVTHPEGHDLLGKAEQAVMLLLSVFLRPILMIFGLLAGMVLSYVALRMLNGGFDLIAAGIVKDQVGNIDTLFVFITMVVIYIMLVVGIVQQCFSTIYVIPAKVLRWIGGAEDRDSAAEQALGAIKGGVQSSGEGLSKGIMQPAGEGAKQIGQSSAQGAGAAGGPGGA